MKTRSLFVIPMLAASGLAFAGDDWSKSAAEKVKMLDADADGRVSATEYTASPGKTRAEFDRIDRNADGYATAAEMEAHGTMKQGDKGDDAMEPEEMDDDA